MTVPASAILDAWTLSEQLSLWQLVFTVLGFAVAIVQLWRTANATVASRKLLAARLASNDLLALLPELHGLEDAFDAAVKSKQGDRVEQALVAYFRAAGRVQGYLEANEKTKDEPIVKYLKQSISVARSAKIELASGPMRTLEEVAKLPREKIVKVTQEATALVARLQRETK